MLAGWSLWAAAYNTDCAEKDDDWRDGDFGLSGILGRGHSWPVSQQQLLWNRSAAILTAADVSQRITTALNLSFHPYLSREGGGWGWGGQAHEWNLRFYEADIFL